MPAMPHDISAFFDLTPKGGASRIGRSSVVYSGALGARSGVDEGLNSQRCPDCLYSLIRGQYFLLYA